MLCRGAGLGVGGKRPSLGAKRGSQEAPSGENLEFLNVSHGEDPV